MRCSVQWGRYYEEKRGNLEALDIVGWEWIAFVRKENRRVHSEG